MLTLADGGLEKQTPNLADRSGHPVHAESLLDREDKHGNRATKKGCNMKEHWKVIGWWALILGSFPVALWILGALGILGG